MTSIDLSALEDLAIQCRPQEGMIALVTPWCSPRDRLSAVAPIAIPELIARIRELETDVSDENRSLYAKIRQLEFASAEAERRYDAECDRLADSKTRIRELEAELAEVTELAESHNRSWEDRQ